MDLWVQIHFNETPWKPKGYTTCTCTYTCEYLQSPKSESDNYKVYNWLQLSFLNTLIALIQSSLTLWKVGIQCYFIFFWHPEVYGISQIVPTKNMSTVGLDVDSRTYLQW